MAELLVVEINETLARDLASDEFLSQQRNVVLVGSTGSGKTHISVTIAGDGCRNAERAQSFFVSKNRLLIETSPTHNYHWAALSGGPSLRQKVNFTTPCRRVLSKLVPSNCSRSR
ncbi:hypothetical protein EQ718_06480 [Paracoccus versutus]|uniref:IstB-like ATP binding protein n=1 Tax=Paracoccus versutus TaxID=34007 RepID=A0AAQ0KM05_PARVE|nr:IstB-like ATP binding protein [Paracoccus versutus]WEJ78549.1 hypothetical protein EQ718_06480 [Paracoccus versutus]